VTVNVFATPGGTNLLGGAVTLRRNPKPGESNNPAKQWVFNSAKTNYDLTHGKTISEVAKDKSKQPSEKNTKENGRNMAPAHKVAFGNLKVPQKNDINYEALKLYRKCAVVSAVPNILRSAGSFMARAGKNPVMNYGTKAMQGYGVGNLGSVLSAHATGFPLDDNFSYGLALMAPAIMRGRRPRTLRRFNNLSNKGLALAAMGSLQRQTWGNGQSMLLDPRGALNQNKQEFSQSMYNNLHDYSIKAGFGGVDPMLHEFSKLRFLKYLPPYKKA
jgi:hypothetical protein